MPDDALPNLTPAPVDLVISNEHREALRRATASGFYESEQEALNDALDLFAERRASFERDLRPFLEKRLRQAREDLAAGRCLTVERAFVDLRARVQARERGEPVG